MALRMTVVSIWDFRRKAAPEWLDEDQGSPVEIAAALRSIAFVNNWFGGNRVHSTLLRQAAAGRRELAVLEVAAGRATALIAAARALSGSREHRGTRLSFTLLDRQASHLPNGWPAQLASPRMLQGDALAIPLPDKSVDVVISSLFVHHLAPDEVARFLREALRVARVAVLINDLERTRVHYALAKLFSSVDPSRISSHDGPVSVRQAYTGRELATFMAATGCRGTVRQHYLYRLAATLWVDDGK